ncbi:MAG: putative lipid II flippase FtsW [Deltaproteobacteria bacterium]|nr:putative lipid II flippase FtsW [Deltaproteobacteria bacterium]
MIRPFSFFYHWLLDHQRQGYDLILLAATLLLLLAGTLMIYSASGPLSDRVHGTSFLFLRNHLLHLSLGLAAMAVSTRIPFRRWEDWMPYLLLVCFLFLIAVLIPGIGYTAGGARRWLRLGFFNFQPSELLKLTLILYVASYLARKPEHVSQFLRGLAPNMAVMGVFLALVVMQPDFGSMVLIVLTLLAMVFVGGAKPSHLLFSVFGFSIIAGWLIASRTYRMKRMLAYLDPWQDRLDSGFQIIQSYLAFGRGGVFGQGLGDSTQKMFFLPDAHTDFIFSIVGEELGLLGVLAFMGMYLLFLWRAFRVALRCEDDFGKYLAFGLSVLFTLQIMLNMGVVMGLLPTKGLPLPFLSYGGSGLVIYLLMVGILLNIGRDVRSISMDRTPGSRKTAFVRE